MALPTPHPGKWELLLNASKCELNTVNCAIHAAVIANRNTGGWKVLYFPEFGNFRSRIWDPPTRTK